MWATKPYRDAIKIQEFLFNDATNPGTKPSDRALLARAWDCLEERKRVMKMRPAPKAVDAATFQKGKPRVVGPGFAEA